mgnify:FL=1
MEESQDDTDVIEDDSEDDGEDGGGSATATQIDDPANTAKKIIERTLGGIIAAPPERGRLFSRDATGRITTPGVEGDDVKKERVEKSQRVLDILHSTAKQ